MIRALALRWHLLRQRVAQGLRRYGKALDEHATVRIAWWRGR